MGIISSAPEVAGWLDGLTGEKRSAVEHVREVVRQTEVDVNEIVYHGALGYSTSRSGFDRVISVALATHHLTLGFFFGAALDDPDHLLQGDGKRMRHVKIRHAEDTQDPAVRQLISQGLERGALHTQQLHRR